MEGVQMLHCLSGDENCRNGYITKKEQVLKLNEHTSYLYLLFGGVYLLRWLLCQQFSLKQLLAKKQWTRKHIHTLALCYITRHEWHDKNFGALRYFFISLSPHDIYVEHLYSVFSFRIKLNENTTFPWTRSHGTKAKDELKKIEDVNMTQLLMLLHRFHLFHYYRLPFNRMVFIVRLCCCLTSLFDTFRLWNTHFALSRIFVIYVTISHFTMKTVSVLISVSVQVCFV